MIRALPPDALARMTPIYTFAARLSRLDPTQAAALLGPLAFVNTFRTAGMQRVPAVTPPGIVTSSQGRDA